MYQTHGCYGNCSVGIFLNDFCQDMNHWNLCHAWEAAWRQWKLRGFAIKVHQAEKVLMLTWGILRKLGMCCCWRAQPTTMLHRQMPRWVCRHACLYSDQCMAWLKRLCWTIQTHITTAEFHWFSFDQNQLIDFGFKAVLFRRDQQVYYLEDHRRR